MHKYFYIARQTVHPLPHNNILHIILSIIIMWCWLSLNSVYAQNDSSLLSDLTKYITQNNFEEVDRLLKMGVNPNKIYGLYLPFTTAIGERLLNNSEKSLEPKKLLLLALRTSCTKFIEEKKTMEEDSTLKEQKIALVKLALLKDADPNDKKILMAALNQETPEVLELLFNNDHKKLDPKFVKKLIAVSASSYWQANNLESLLANPSLALKMKYQNLGVKPATYHKIPRILHHIWLTNKNVKKELLPEDITNVIKTKEIFSKAHKGWQHIVWTNDKTLIPNSAKTLENNGIQVRQMSEIENHFILRNKIYEYIEQGRWGMATNCLRYEVINYYGGIYADLNYIFVRDLEPEIHKYDFFTQTYKYGNGFFIDNFFFGAIPNHPFMVDLISLVYRNLYNPPEYIAILEEKGNRGYTDEVTASPTSDAYFRTANKNGTIDVVYPYIDLNYQQSDSHYYADKNTNTENKKLKQIEEILLKYTDCAQDFAFIEKIRKFYNYLAKNEICGTKEQLIGEDSKNGNTWVNPEWDG